jgi:hypothetical protein
MKMHMIDLLMRNPSIVLKKIIVLCPRSRHQFLDYGQDLRQLVVGDISQFLAVVFGNYQLPGIQISSQSYVRMGFWCVGLGLGIGRGSVRRTYGVPARKGVDVEEGEDFVGFKDLEGGDVSCLLL